MQAQTAAKKKAGFKMPHLLFLMLGLIMLVSLLTYIVPAGSFATDPETKKLIGTEFSLLGHQTPVSPIQALLYILPGLQNSSLVISLLLVSGGCIGVTLGCGAIDEMINWAVYKLQDKGVAVLVPMMFIMMGFLGGFGGGDSLIAIVPVGVVFAKKMRLDPIIAVAVTFFASFIGFGTGPTRVMLPQLMMNVPLYSGFGIRFATMCVALLVGMIFTLRYAQKISKNPAASAMGDTAWLETAADPGTVKEVPFNPKAAVVTAIFFGQYVLIVWLRMAKEAGNEIMPAVLLVSALLCGLIYGMKPDDIGKAFTKGVGGMAFVGVIIGFAGAMSLVLTNGNILHTVVYYATLPLQQLSMGFAAIGMSAIISFLNFFIPSASSKAAILIPIIQPMAETLGMPLNLAVSVFQLGDGWTNLITPALGVTAGSMAIAGVPFSKWVKWAAPCVVFMTVCGWGLLYLLAAMGWTGI